MTINATQLRVGMIIVHERDLYRVTSVRHLTPGNKRGFMQANLTSRIRDAKKSYGGCKVLE
jgi:translation elongation factor P/translation initiation factor 5A